MPVSLSSAIELAIEFAIKLAIALAIKLAIEQSTSPLMCQLLHVGIDQAKRPVEELGTVQFLLLLKGRTPQRIPSVFVNCKCQRNLSFSTFAAIWISSRLSLCFVIANAKAKLFLGQIYLGNNLSQG